MGPSSGSVDDVSISERELGLDRGLPWNEHFHIQAGQVRGWLGWKGYGEI